MLVRLKSRKKAKKHLKITRKLKKSHSAVKNNNPREILSLQTFFSHSLASPLFFSTHLYVQIALSISSCDKLSLSSASNIFQTAFIPLNLKFSISSTKFHNPLSCNSETHNDLLFTDTVMSSDSPSPFLPEQIGLISSP